MVKSKDPTNAARQRRYIANLKAKAQGVVNEARFTELQRRHDELQQRYNALRQGVTNATAQPTPSNETAALRHEIRSLRAQLAQAKAAAKPKAASGEDVTALQQQLKAARTRIGNLQVEVKAAWTLLEGVRKANPVTITQADYNKLRKVFHPDSEARVSEERKAQLTEVARIFNAVKFKIIKPDRS